MSEPIRYRVYHEGKVLGPMAADELKNQPWYHSGVLVCAENVTGINAADWKKVEEILDLIPKSSVPAAQTAANENPSYRAPLATRVVNIENLANNVASKQISLEQKIQEELDKTNQLFNKSMAEIYAQLSKQTGQIEQLLKSSQEALAALSGAEKRIGACEAATPEIPKLKSAVETLRHDLATQLEEIRWERKKIESAALSQGEGAGILGSSGTRAGARSSAEDAAGTSGHMPKPASASPAPNPAIAKSRPQEQPISEPPPPKSSTTQPLNKLEGDVSEKTMPFVFLNKENPQRASPKTTELKKSANIATITGNSKSKKLILATVALLILIGVAAMLIQPKKKIAQKTPGETSATSAVQSFEKEAAKIAQNEKASMTAAPPVESTDGAAQKPANPKAQKTAASVAPPKAAQKTQPKAAKKSAGAPKNAQSASVKDSASPAPMDEKTGAAAEPAALPGLMPGMGAPETPPEEPKSQDSPPAEEPEPAAPTDKKSETKDQSTDYFQ
ncbi:MAG: hypothetical protein HY547_10330 [Elusimicrobia bacterium]|nr:hypothetical protein [Elusimicrobiota bacterium]